MEKSWCKGEAASVIRNCLEHVQDMTQLIVDVLLLEQAESGRLVGRQEQVDLARVARDLVKNLKPIAEKKGLGLVVETETELLVTGDPGQLKRLLANLLDNAIKYTDPGGTVSVEGLRSASRIDLIVRDTGMGIPAGHLHRVFERFYQVDPERSRREGGCGLGLSIARALAERNGGSVTVESTAGKGSCFTFKMRLYQ
jgi:two-component system phosphate regulon sensor histidine kinase PhoR